MSIKTENLFPQEIQRAITCLSDDNRQKIVSKLLEDPEIAYTTLKDSVRLTKGNLNHHLSELIKAGIIAKFLRNTVGHPYESFYTISEFGRDFINGIFESLKPTESKISTHTDVGSISQPPRRVLLAISTFKKLTEASSTKEYMES
jgi:DNA-binding HxlR family transcriptional regulator